MKTFVGEHLEMLSYEPFFRFPTVTEASAATGDVQDCPGALPTLQHPALQPCITKKSPLNIERREFGAQDGYRQNVSAWHERRGAPRASAQGSSTPKRAAKNLNVLAFRPSFSCKSSPGLEPNVPSDGSAPHGSFPRAIT